MFEQDYIIRLIKEMIRAILKLLFNVNTDSPIEDLIEDKESQKTLERLLDIVDNGNINEAENQIYDMTSDNSMTNLEVALLFYSYLNDKDDEFLQKHGFCRDEIKSGVTELASRYGLMGMVEIFLSDSYAQENIGGGVSSFLNLSPVYNNISAEGQILYGSRSAQWAAMQFPVCVPCGAYETS